VKQLTIPLGIKSRLKRLGIAHGEIGAFGAALLSKCSGTLPRLVTVLGANSGSALRGYSWN
jgi:hypothetical protein